MSDQTGINQPVRVPPPVSTGKAIALAIGFIVGGALATVLAEELGRYVGGDAGAWTGWGLAFAALCVLSGIVALRFSTQPGSIVTILCAILPALAAGSKVEEYTRSLDWGSWARVAYIAGFLVVYCLWYTVVGTILRRRR